MIESLKEIVIPELRNLNFKGSFPLTNQIMAKKLLLALIVTTFFSCDFTSKNNLLNPNKKWVYVELAVKNKDTTPEYYYYYGQMYERVLDNIANDENYEALFVLSKVRYIKHEDGEEKVLTYEDNIDEGTIYFNTGDIVKLEILKKDPLPKNIEEKQKDSTNTVIN